MQRISLQEEEKQNLKLYIETNRTFIEQKVYNEFNVECLQEYKLSQLDTKKMTKVIKSVFQIGAVLLEKSFEDKIQQNIQNFITDQYSKKTTAHFHILDIDKLLAIIIYVIDNGMDAEKEKPQDVKIVKPKQVVIRQPVKYVYEEIIVKEKVDEYIHIKPRISTFLDKDLIPYKKEFKIQKHSMPQINVAPRYLIVSNKPTKIQKPISVIEKLEPVEALNTNFIQENRQNLNERLQKLYQYYCLQQFNIGLKPTFDQIKQQSQNMNLGKFLIFCKNTELFLQSKGISKESLIQTFKRIAQGKSYIQFNQFKILLERLDKKYKQDLAKKPENIKKQIPSYEARLRLHDAKKYKKFIIHLNLVFNTRQIEGRQIKLKSAMETFKNKNLTSHSGKFSNDLSVNLKDIFEKARSLGKNVVGEESEKQKKAKKLNTIHLKDLKIMKEVKMQWIGYEDEEENLYMAKGENLNKSIKLVANLKKRVTEVEKMERKRQMLRQK